MRAFAYVTATVLIVIAIGVSALAGLNGGGLGPVGTVSGYFLLEGGPLPGIRAAPVDGPVTLTNPAGATFTTMANSKGGWMLWVPPGTYVVSGFNPRLGGHCRAGNLVRVGAGGSVRGVLVACPIS